MARFFVILFLLAAAGILLLAGPIQAGDDGRPAPRKVFRESPVYPYTFVPVSYLETGGPKMMRYAESEGGCAHRDAPLLPSPTPVPSPKKEAKSEDTEKKETTPAATPIHSQHTPAPGEPAFPPPENAPAAGTPDLTRTPDEVMSYFKNPYNAGTRGRHLFDPIFDPGYHDGPKSKASYQLTDKP
jgi:hypothetical protein